MSVFGGPSIVKDTLLFHVDPANRKSYPGTGTSLTDFATSNGHTIGLSSSPTFSTANGGCFDHGADTGANVSIDSHSSFVTAKSWEIWFNPDTVPASNTFDSVFQHSNNWNGNTGISMQMIYGNFTWSWGQSWGGSCSVSLSNITAGSWHHAIGTSDGTTDAEKCKLYLNGVLVDTGTAGAIPSSQLNIKIGDGNGGNIDGKTSCFSVYSKELSADEVMQNFQAKRGRFGL